MWCRIGRLAGAVAIIAVLGLSGCGRKGELEAPPSALDAPTANGGSAQS